MEITGKVVKLKPIETFQSGFQKRTVVVKTDYLNDIEMALNTNSSES